MIIRCPNCNTGYNLPTEKLGAGRNVKCTQCAHVWFQEGKKVEEPAEIPPLPAENEQLKSDSFSEHKPEQSRSNKVSPDVRCKKRIAIVSAAVIAVILTVVTTTIILAHSYFSNMVEDVANSMGVDTPAETIEVAGLEIPTDRVERTLTETEPTTLTFTGIVKNTQDTEIAIPRVVVSLYNEKGMLLDKWPAYVAKRTLKAGEETQWTCRFFAPALDKISEHRITFEKRSLK